MSIVPPLVAARRAAYGLQKVEFYHPGSCPPPHPGERPSGMPPAPAVPQSPVGEMRKARTAFNSRSAEASSDRFWGLVVQITMRYSK